MKKTLLIIVLIVFIGQSFGQVGIGTTSPQGILDVTSSTYGVVYPNVSLSSTIVEAPVQNPNGGSLVDGTTVYNTNTTNTGNNDVEPGIYVWNGSQWITHFNKKQSQIYTQTSSFRARSVLPFRDVPGIGVADVRTFRAKYTGLYRIEVKTNFGAGEMVDNGDVNVGYQEGTFRFRFDGAITDFKTKAYSIYNDHINSGTHYSNLWKESYITLYVNLTAGQLYSLSLQFDMEDAPGFFSNGSINQGRGYVGEGTPCIIEFTYIDE